MGHYKAEAAILGLAAVGATALLTHTDSNLALAIAGYIAIVGGAEAVAALRHK